jgi:hypothetical protein
MAKLMQILEADRTGQMDEIPPAALPVAQFPGKEKIRAVFGSIQTVA